MFLTLSAKERNKHISAMILKSSHNRAQSINLKLDEMDKD